MSNDAIERLCDYAINKWTDGISVKDARAILVTFYALTDKCEEQDRMLIVAGEALIAMQAERDALTAELTNLQEQIDELRENEIWRKIHND
jgi:hypothetical protein